MLIIFIFSGQYEESSGFEKFFVNICGNSVTPCDGKFGWIFLISFFFWILGKNYPVTNDYFGTCGYLGTSDFDVKLLGLQKI